MSKKTFMKCAGVALSGLMAASPVLAEEMPKTMEEMWKIIQAQQKEIEVLKAKQAAAEEAAATTTAGKPAEGGETDRKLGILGEEIEKLKTKLVIPDEPEYKSMYGLGPAASKVYQVSKGLSIGGYGEAFYQNLVDDEGTKKDNADFLRFVLYTGYKFSDNILFNSELEFEHASTSKSGSVSVEFANLDFFLHPMANARAGLVLVPMGFINEIHEPPFFHGVQRPEVERRIIPSTWRELGGGLFGEILPGLQYRMYAITGLLAGDEDDVRFSSDGIRGGRQGGSKSVAEDWAFTGRVDYSPRWAPGLLVGGSAFLGNAAHGEDFGGKDVDVFTQLYEGHIQYRYRGLELRALGSWGHIDNAGVLSAAAGETIGSENFGWYAEAAYDVMPHLFPDSIQYLAPFVRYERLDTIAKAPSGFADDEFFDREIWQAGLTYKPIPNVVLKADYRNFVAKSGERPDEFNLGLGFIF
ncbi:MAG: hypothetical protein ABFS02_07345 [Pseudomonadota bacterium]